MSSPEDRVAIAKDVIKALDTKRLVASSGAYLEFVGINAFFEENMESDARDALKDRQCEVCAKGALLVAAIDRFDECKLSDIYSQEEHASAGVVIDGPSSSSKKFLSRFFDEDQLALMEIAFEGSCYVSHDTTALHKWYCSGSGYEGSPVQHAEDFYHGFDCIESLLRGIMQNVIDNGGEFVPPPSQ